MHAYIVTVPNFSIAIAPKGIIQGAMVGDNQTILCMISTVSGVKLNAIAINWIGPRGTTIANDDRTIISLPTLSSSNNYANNFSSSLDFMHLKERDEGRYMCNVSILQASASITVEVGALIGTYVSTDYILCMRTYVSLHYNIVPTPTVSVAVLTNQTAGEPLTLYCNVTTVKGITSSVDIMWLVDGLQLEIADPNVSLTSDGMQLYMTSYTIEQLRASDNERVYQCRVKIGSDPLVMASYNFTLNVTGKYVYSLYN